jgi:hypothetical protein
MVRSLRARRERSCPAHLVLQLQRGVLRRLRASARRVDRRTPRRASVRRKRACRRRSAAARGPSPSARTPPAAAPRGRCGARRSPPPRAPAGAAARSRTSRRVHLPHTICAVMHTGQVSSTAISTVTLPTEVAASPSPRRGAERGALRRDSVPRLRPLLGFERSKPPAVAGFLPHPALSARIDVQPRVAGPLSCC